MTLFLSTRTTMEAIYARGRLRWIAALYRWRWKRLCRLVGVAHDPNRLALEEDSKRRREELAVLGEFSAGKSSLLNALLGSDVLPTGLVETTGIPASVTHARVERLRVGTATRGLEVVKGPLSSLDWSALPPDGEIAIELPAKQLRGLALVDTPGTNTPNESHRAHAETVARRSLAWLYLTRAEQALRKSEVDWLVANIAQHQPMVLCLSQADRLTPAEMDVVMKASRQKLRDVGLVSFTCLPVSVKGDPPGIRSRARLLRVLRRVTRAMPALDQIRSAHERSVALERSFQEGLCELRTHIQLSSARATASLEQATDAAQTAWLVPLRRQLVEQVDRAQFRVLEQVQREYDARLQRVTGERADVPTKPPIEHATMELRTAVQSILNQARTHTHYAEPADTSYLPPLGLIPEGAPSSPVGDYKIQSLPTGGFILGMLGTLFQSEEQNRNDRRALHVRFIESERVRWSQYVRDRYSYSKQAIDRQIQQMASAEASAASRAMAELRDTLSQLDRRDIKVRAYVTSGNG